MFGLVRVVDWLAVLGLDLLSQEDSFFLVVLAGILHLRGDLKQKIYGGVHGVFFAGVVVVSKLDFFVNFYDVD